MTIEMNAKDDLAQVVDALESVVLRRASSATNVAVSTARRQYVVTSKATPSHGAARQADAVWHLQLPAGEIAPGIGDLIIDAESSRWTILEVEALPRLGRWKCAARDLSIAFGCCDRVDVERAVWDDLGSGPEIVDWVYVVSAIPVKIQPRETTVDDSVDPPVTTEFFQIVLSESLDFEPDDRLVAEDGAVYTIQSYEQAERIDVLPIVYVVRSDV